MKRLYRSALWHLTLQAMMMETGKAAAPDFGPDELLEKAQAAIAKAEGTAVPA